MPRAGHPRDTFAGHTIHDSHPCTELGGGWRNVETHNIRCLLSFARKSASTHRPLEENCPLTSAGRQEAVSIALEGRTDGGREGALRRILEIQEETPESGISLEKKAASGGATRFNSSVYSSFCSLFFFFFCFFLKIKHNTKL